jgi:hypothetical protein
LLAIGFASGSNAAAQGDALFPGSELGLDGIVFQIDVADVNGDGQQDFVVVVLFGGHSPSGELSTLLADGHGGYTRRDHPFPDLPGSVALGDLDADGELDAVTSNTNVNPVPGHVSVLRGDGAGGFTSETDYAVGGEPRGVALGDLNGDGKLDLVTDNGAVFLGNGAGGFGPRRAPGANGNAVALADLDRDGRLDLVTTAPVRPWSPSASATWEPSVRGLPTGLLRVLVVAELSGDGRADIATVNRARRCLGALGDTRRASRRGPTTRGDGPEALAAGDVDGDGVPDIATADTLRTASPC